MKTRFCVVGFLLVAVILSTLCPSRSRAEVMLQWFESDWDEMYRRLPEVATIGYDYLWIPPPTKAPTGLGTKWSNVGYSLYDRFDVGDVPQRGSLATRYGTRGSLRNMVDKAHQLDIKIIPDIVMNHNGNGPNILTYPGMKPTDFHLAWDENYANDLDFRRAPRMNQWYHYNGYGGTMWQELANLIDIRTEDHVLNGDPKRFTGQKTIEGVDFNFVDGTKFIRHVGEYDKYPYSGSYTNAENAADYLYRWIAWLGNVMDYDGLRLDAGKHTPYEFFGWHHAGFLHEAQWNYNLRHGYSDTGYPDDADTLFLNNIKRDDALIFAEILSPWSEIQYWFGTEGDTRNPMRFLDYGMKQNAGESFNGNMSALGAYGKDFGPNNGILYVWGHDEGGPGKINLAYAYILTHVGFPMVYFTGNNITWDDHGRSPDKKTWMIPGYDEKALGRDGNDITQLVWIHQQFARGNEEKRWHSDGDFFALERYDDMNSNGHPDAGEGLLLTCLNDSGGDITKYNVTVSFPVGTVLHDYTGHAGDIAVYQNGIYHQVNVTVPGNGGQGWVCYAPRNADPVGDGISVSQGGGPVPTMPWVIPGGTHGTDENRQLSRITDTNIAVDVLFDPVGGNVDSVTLKWGQGIDLTGSMSTDVSLVNYGFMGCSPRNATNHYLDIDLTPDNIPEGLNVIKARVFNERSGLPALYNTFTKVVYVDRRGPEVSVAQPAPSEMIYGDCVAVISNADFTAYGMTVSVDGGPEETAHEVMKGLWKYNLDGLSSGNHTMVVTTTEADWAQPTRNIINTSIVERVFNVTSNANSLAISHAEGAKLEVPFFETVVTAGGAPADVKLYWDGYELPFNNGDYTNAFNGQVVRRDDIGNVETGNLWGAFCNGQHFFEAVSVVGGFTNRTTRRVEFDLYGGVAKYGGHGTIDSDGDGLPDAVEMPGFDQGAPGPDQHYPGDNNNNFIPEWGENWTRLNPFNHDTFYTGVWDGDERSDFDDDGHSNFEEVYAGYLAGDVYMYDIYDSGDFPSGGTTASSYANWVPSNSVERGASLTVIYYPMDGRLKGATQIEMHVGHSAKTSVDWQDVVDTNMTAIGGGAWQASYMVPGDATSVDFTFWDGVSEWDGQDYQATVVGDTNTFFTMDGVFDGAHGGAEFTVFDAVDHMKILAAVRSNNLYVATYGVGEAPAKSDHFIYVTDVLGDASDPAPGWEKSGLAFVDTSTKPRLMAEGENTWEGWANIFGVAENANGGALEGEINLIDAFGSVPEAVYIAAVSFGTTNYSVINSQGPRQWEEGDTPNLDVTEFLRVPIASIRDADEDGYFDCGRPQMWTVVNGATNDANYGLRRFFINELAGDSESIAVRLKPNVNGALSRVEVFSNLNRRDFAVLPGDEDWDVITTLSQTNYYRAYEMAGPDGDGVYTATLPVNRCGAYRINARYKVDGGDYVYYTDNGLRRDCAVVVSPTKALELTMYELNPMTAEATTDDFYGRSTFEDMYITNADRPNVLDTNYYADMGLNMIWLQPIHPIGSDGRETDPATGDDYDPGSPYAVKNYWKVNSVLGDPSSEARAMLEFANYVAALDERGVGVMLDGTFNHSAWDCEIGQIGVEMGLTYDVVSTDTNNVTTTNVVNVQAGDLIREVRPQWYSKRNGYGEHATYYGGQTATDIAVAPDRIDFGKWNDAADFFFGRYDCLVQEGAANTNWAWSSSWHRRYLLEEDRFEGFDSLYTRELWQYFARYPLYWLEQSGHPAGTAKEQSGRGIDGLRCDFAQGLPSQFWEYTINRTRSVKWDFLFMAESLDGFAEGYANLNNDDRHHGVGFRSSRHFDILNENMVFHWKSIYFNHGQPASPDPDTGKTAQALSIRSNAFAGSPILLNLTSHDEIFPTASQWRLGYAYATVAAMGGVPMVFYGQEAGAQNNATYYSGRGNDAGNNFARYEVNFGKSIPNFKRYNHMTNIWNNINPGGWAVPLQAMYERIGKARERSPALQSMNNYFLSVTNAGGGYRSDIFAVAKYQQAGMSAASQDVVFAFVNNNIDDSTDRFAAYEVDIDHEGSNLFGIENGESYNLWDLMSTNPTAYVWSSNKLGSTIFDEGLKVWLHEDAFAGKQAQYLKLVDVNATYPDYATYKAWDADNDGLPDWWETLYGLSTSSGAADDGPNGDRDKDGMSNLVELRAGTNPDDPTDYLRVSISPVGGGMQVEWTAKPDMNYQVEQTEELLPAAWQEKGGLRTATSTSETEMDYSVGSSTSRFYRVKVKP